MPKVYNKRHKDIPKDAIYVGRPTRWGNPYHIGKHGDRDTIIKRFEVYAIAKHQRDPTWLTPLRNKNLVCWCKPQSCHADILLKLANS